MKFIIIYVMRFFGNSFYRNGYFIFFFCLLLFFYWCMKMLCRVSFVLMVKSQDIYIFDIFCILSLFFYFSILKNGQKNRLENYCRYVCKGFVFFELCGFNKFIIFENVDF